MSSGQHYRDVKAELDEIVEHVMDGLTPFQRATVERIDKLYGEGRMRVLVADEVGLGKTIVAKGVVAKMAKRRFDEGDDLVKVVYICSNGAIAEQNLRKLQVHPDSMLEPGAGTRLSMQHLKLANEKAEAAEYRQRYIQMIPLTPSTSFKLENSMGNQEERALIFAVLEYDEAISGTVKSRLKRLLWCNNRENAVKGYWDVQVGGACSEVAKLYKSGIIFEGLEEIYPLNILASVKNELKGEECDFESIVEYLEQTPPAKFDWQMQRKIVVSLRRAFSKANIELMDPDFVIMDEFQRFHDLVADNESEMSLLANRFLGSKDIGGEKRQARVLLLSATPFRMYSTQAEDDDEAFGSSDKEFNDVISFLSNQNQEELCEFSKVWSDYSRELHALNAQGVDVLAACLSKKEVAQDELGKLIVRTERVSTNELTNLIASELDPDSLEISEADIIPFFAMQQILEQSAARTSLISPDYAKSCPFPFSFMGRYKAKSAIDNAIRGNWKAFKKSVTKGKKVLWLDAEAIDAYRALNVEHARYKKLREDAFEGFSSRASQLLWVPPSVFYYEPSQTSPFSMNRDFSKTLVFSSWAMVPPSLSCLLSYDAEKRNVDLLTSREGNRSSFRYFKNSLDEDEINEETDTTVLPHNRLRFRGSNPNAFLIAYPSRYLARIVDFSSIAKDGVTLAELRRRVAGEIKRDFLDLFGLRSVPTRAGRERTEWYDVAVLLLDSMEHRRRTVSLESALKLVRSIKSPPSKDSDFDDAGKALEALVNRYDGFDIEALLESIPSDLFDVLADVAIGAPGVCALRAYRQAAKAERLTDDEIASKALEFGCSFVTKMNTADATLCVAVAMEKGRSIPSAHWKRLLGYCCEGNFQSMLDEYVHLVYEGNLASAHRQIVGPRLGSDRSPSLHKAETRVQIETFESFSEKAKGRKRWAESTRRMRCTFAAGFMEDVGGRSRGENRRAELRAAFNSPFRPFVLVSTSVGQEGLDFHQYCKRIVHWNLPTSPIDFEQREGRINRYKCLAVRRSLANRYGEEALGSANLWNTIFDVARERENSEGDFGEHGSGLLPYWGVRDGEGKVPIERVVYNYPFSRDESLYRYLLYTMVNYRAVLGQPNQEELLAMLQRKFDTDFKGEDLKQLFVNLAPIVAKLRKKGGS